MLSIGRNISNKCNKSITSNCHCLSNSKYIRSKSNSHNNGGLNSNNTLTLSQSNISGDMIN